MHLALTNIAGPAHPRVARGLGERAFNPTARLIHGTELGRPLPGPSGQEHLVAFSWKADRHAPPGHSRFGAPHPQRTGLAGGLGEPDRDDRLAFRILAVMPGDAVLALGTGHDLVIPVDVELGDIEGARGMRLPTRVDVHWPHQVNIVHVTAFKDAFGTDVTGIDEVLLWHEVFVRQLRLNGFQGMVVLLGSGRRLNLGNEMGQVVVAALGHMHLVADPVEVALAAVADLRIVR